MMESNVFNKKNKNIKYEPTNINTENEIKVKKKENFLIDNDKCM